MRSGLFVILFCLVLFFLILYFYLPRIVISVDITLSGILFPRKIIKGKKHKNTISFTTFDGLKLNARIQKAKTDSLKATIIFLHGIRSSKEQYLALAKRMAQLGYSSVALDLRGHGHSEGKYCTFGAKEKQDVQTLLDVLQDHPDISKNIGVWGHSLGAAVALQTIAEEPRIQFAIVESTFSDFRTIVHDYAGIIAGIKYLPLSNFLVDRAGEIEGFTPATTSPRIACSRIKKPVLMVHGNKDNSINIRYGKANFENLKSTHKKFITIEGADHANVWDIGGETYFQQVEEYIESILKLELKRE